MTPASSDAPDSGWTLAAIRVRLAGAFPAMMRTALESLGDDGIWWQPAPSVNPAAVLALHCAGNLQHMIGLHVGGIPYQRNRPLEFDATRRLPLRDVLAELDRAIAAVSTTLDTLDDAALAGPSRDPDGRYRLLGEDLLSSVTHFALHTGQVVQLAKMRGATLPAQVWGDAHRASGASRV